MVTPTKATEEIVRELKEGTRREENFRLLFERYYGQLYRFFRRKMMSPEDSRDLTQAVLISVHKGLKGLRDDSQFEAWLFKIAMNEYRNELERRHAKKRDVVPVSLDSEAGHADAQPFAALVQATAPGTDPMQTLLEKEKLEKLRAALEKLPEQMRRCVQLRVAQDLSYQEIASVMGISVNTVKAHLYQAQRALREKLRPYFSEVEI